MYENVLIAVDQSDGAHEATKHGLTIAEQFDATVHALSVAADQHRDHLRFDPEDEAETAIEQFESRALDYDVTPRTEIRDGPTQREILTYIEDEEIDLAVLGTHGRSGLDRVITGSVAEGIGREASAPVLTVKADGE